jgi:hypothetical protein
VASAYGAFASVREALVTAHGWEADRATAAQGRLHVRVRVLVNLDPLTPLADRLSTIAASSGMPGAFGHTGGGFRVDDT